MFGQVSAFFVELMGFALKGSEFVFGPLSKVDGFGFVFAFQVLPTIAGAVMAAYIGMLGGDSVESKKEFATILLCASIMNAPAALYVAKILVPVTGVVNRNFTISKESVGGLICWMRSLTGRHRAEVGAECGCDADRVSRLNCDVKPHFF